MKSRETNVNTTVADTNMEFKTRPAGPLFATVSHHVLEQRIAFDGALVPTVVDTADQAEATAPAAPETTAATENAANETQALADALAETASAFDAQPDSTNIVFIDSAVRNPALIAQAVSDGSEVVLLEAGRDGLEQIAEYLEGRSGIESIHIVSHGEAGELRLGNATVTTDSINGEHADELAIIAAALTDTADILIYGCNFADDLTAVEALADATGADIAASNDDTGAADLGGDWDLEVTTGAIEAASFAAPEWDGLLAPLSISVSAPPTVDSVPIPVGGSSVWTNAGFIGGTAIDLRVTVVSADPGVVVAALTIGDDPSIAVDTGGFGLGGSTAGSATLRWEIFEAGTGQTVFAIGAPKFTVSDIDGSGAPNTIETIAPELNGLQSYTVDPATALNITTSSGLLTASGTDDDGVVPGGPLRLSAAITFNWSERSSWDVTYTAERNGDGRIFAHDGDGDFVFVNGVTTNLLGIDLDDNNSTASGTSYDGSFTEGGAAVAVVDSDVIISQHTALGTNLGSATVTLTNAQAGDILALSALPAGITASINTSVAGEITVTLSGNASVADYETALQAITFENTSNDPNTTDRQIQVLVTNTTFGTSSLAALSTISVTPVNDAPAGADNTIPATEDTPHNFTTTEFGFSDTDGNALNSVIITTLPNAAGGVLTLNGTPVTAGQEISAAQIANLVFTPASNINGNGLGSFTFQVKDDGGTANSGEDTDQSPNTIAFNISPVNDAPTADDESVITDEDVPVTIDILDGDTDVDGTIDPASVGIEDPANPGTFVTSLTETGVGTWTVDTNPVSPTFGQITFTPVLHYNGPVTPITYQVADNDGATTTATVDVALDGVNDAPSANPETFTINEDAGLAANVLTNDTDVDGHPLTVISATVDLDGDGNQDNLVIGGPAVTLTNGAGDPIGDISLQANGTVIFNPATNYDGPFPQVTYTIDDANGGTATTTLDITITPINDAPVIDLDADDSSLVIGTGFENTFTEDGGPVAAIDTDISITDPDDTGMVQAVIAVGGLADGADEILTIGGTSFALNTAHAGQVTVGGTTFTIVYSAVTGNIGISNNAGGDMPIADLEALLASVTYENTSQNPTAGNRTLDVKVNDGNVDSNIAVSTITVVPVNDDPNAVDDAASTDEDTAISINATNGLIDPNDTDPDSDPLTVTLANQAGNPITIGTPFTVAGGGVLTLNADGSYSFDPGTSYNGLDDGETELETITYTVDDGNGGTDTATLEITVTGSNDAPVIIDPSNPGPDPENPIPADPATIIPVQTVDDGEVFTPATPLVDVSDFATDPDGEPLTFTTTSTLPTGLTLNPDGTVTGTIDPNASQGGDDPVGNPGVYTITVTVGDGDDTSTVTLTIDVSNPPPVAVDDTATVDEDANPANGNVITDAVTGDADTPPDSDPLTVTAATQGANALTIGTPFTVAGGGVLTLNADGSYSFDPGTSYNGLDDGETELETITYTVDDGNGGTDTATLEITVTGSNDAPVIIDPSNPGPDPENPIPADPATIIPVQTVDDGEAFTPATPLVDVSDFATDPDGEPLTFTTTSTLPTGLTLNPDGTVTGSIDPNASQGGDDPVGNPGVYTIQVTVGDGDDTSTVTLTIDVSNPPPVAVDDVATLDEDASPATGNVITDPVTGDADTPPDSDPLTVTAATQGANPITIGTPFTTAGGGVLTLNADGSYSFDPGTSYNGLDDGETELETITYTVDDGNGGTDTATLEITVTGSNDAPVIIDPSNPGPDPENPIPADPATIIPVQNVDDGEVFTPATPLVDVSDFATDPDGEPLTFTTTSTLPTGLTLNPDGTVTGTIDPNASQGGDDPVGNPGVYTIQVTVGDGDDTSTVTLTIDVSNPPPVAVDDTATLDEDAAPATGNVITDPVTGDADTPPDSDPLTVTAATQGANALTIGTPFTVAGGGVLTLNADGSYSFDPGTSYNGLDDGETELETITYTVDDGNGGTDTATLTITVTGSNDAPVIIDPSNPGPDPENPIPADPATIIPVQNVDDGEAFTPATPLVDVSDFATDPDGEPLTFTTTSTLPTGLTLNPDGTVTGTIDPNASQGGDDPVGNPGVYTITVTVSDGDDTSTVTLTIDVSNPPPVAVDDVANTSQNSAVVLSVLGNDHDGGSDSDTLSVITATSNQGTVRINPNGTLLFTPTPGFIGTALVTYVISDGNGSTDTATVKVTVEPRDLTPRAPTPGIFVPGPAGPSQPTDSLSANGAVLEAVNGMLGATGSFFGQAQSIGGADLSQNPVLASINQFSSLDGMPSLGRLYSLNGAAPFTQTEGPIDVVTGHMDRAAHNALIGRIGENGNGLWGPDTITGFSLKYGDASGQHEVVTIETLVNNRTLILQTRPSDDISHLEIERYEVRTVEGGRLPAWLEQLGPGLFMGEWPADVERLNLTVDVILKDGTKLTREITVETPTGEISDRLVDRRAQIVPLFSEQLEARHELTGNEVQALGIAIAR